MATTTTTQAPTMPRVESATFSLSKLLHAHGPNNTSCAESADPRKQPRMYRLVRVEDDGDTARLATQDDVKDLLTMLGPDVDPRSISPVPTPSPAPPLVHHASHNSSKRMPLAGAYKPGGPCNHCGATESPQWRRGPPSKPCLCNACGTRYRRSNALPAATAAPPPVKVAVPSPSSSGGGGTGSGGASPTGPLALAPTATSSGKKRASPTSATSAGPSDKRRK